MRVDERVVASILTGRADKHLPSGPGLRIESDRICCDGVRALQIAQLNQLMPKKSWMTIRDEKVSLSRLHRKTGYQRSCGEPIREYNTGRLKRSSIVDRGRLFGEAH